MDDTRPAAPRGRILLIDDDRVFALWATKVLQARDFEIVHVLEPVSGLRQVESERWDLVITDVEMPRMTGLEFLDRARRLDPTLPVAVVTAHPTVDRAVTTMRQTATEFIQKPITPDDFVARVVALVAQRGPVQARGPESVLAIGAHPGDAKLGAGGDLLAHLAAGQNVKALTMGGGPAGPGAIGTRLSLPPVTDADGPRAAVAAIEKALAQAQPAVLYTHSVHDGDPEHREAHLAAVAAARQVARIYGFQSPSATVDFRPEHFVPVGTHLDGKITAAGEFTSQPEVGGYLDQIAFTARYWARFCDAQPAEAFEVIRDRAG